MGKYDQCNIFSTIEIYSGFAVSTSGRWLRDSMILYHGENISGSVDPSRLFLHFLWCLEHQEAVPKLPWEIIQLIHKEFSTSTSRYARHQGLSYDEEGYDEEAQLTKAFKGRFKLQLMLGEGVCYFGMRSDSNVVTQKIEPHYYHGHCFTESEFVLPMTSENREKSDRSLQKLELKHLNRPLQEFKLKPILPIHVGRQKDGAPILYRPLCWIHHKLFTKIRNLEVYDSDGEN